MIRTWICWIHGAQLGHKEEGKRGWSWKSGPYWGLFIRQQNVTVYVPQEQTVSGGHTLLGFQKI